MKHLSKIEEILFYILFFSIPFQARKILYFSGWYYSEWQSVSIYATDLILLVLFVFWVRSCFGDWQISNFKFLISKQFQNLKSQFQKSDFYLILFIIAAGISVKNSSDFYVGLFLWLKLLEFVLFYFYIKFYALKRFNFVNALYLLIAGGVFQSVVAISQFMKQGDLGLRWLGESVLSPNMSGIASFFTESGLAAQAGDKIIRAYGTTPHPNVLAAYLFLAIFALYFLLLYQKPKKQSSNSQYDIMIYHTIWAHIGLAIYALLLLGLFFTFSRTVIFLWAAGFLARAVLIGIKSRFRQKFWQDSILKTRLVKVALVTILMVVLFSVLYWPEIQSRLTISAEEEAVQLRIFYNKESLGGGLNLFGIGLGDFTSWLMEQKPNLPRHVYQPVHNIYLLIYTEAGIIALISFLLFLGGLIYEFIKRTKLYHLKNYSFLLITLSILIVGLFDHFLFTIQQGRFIFWLGLTLISIGDIIKKSSEQGVILNGSKDKEGKSDSA